MITKCIFVILLLSVTTSYVESYKILVVSPLPSRSHNNLGKGIADILHDAKHEVTYMTCFKSAKPRYRELLIDTSLFPMDKKMMGFDVWANTSVLENIHGIPKIISSFIDSTFLSKDIIEFLNKKDEKFDLIVIEYFLNHALTGLGVKYDCPVIMLSPVTMLHWLARLTGNPVSLATVPSIFLGYSGEMSFMQRLTNFVIGVFQEALGTFYAEGLQRDAYEKYLPDEAARVPYSELREKIALTFTNSHPSIGSVRPLLPNVVEIGGYFISDDKTLPDEYQKILDNSKNGVVFFSMGSNLKSANIPDKVKSGILAALGKRKETILWKYEEDLPQKPKNVIIRSWMPQASILTHPNVKLFITHGGMLSTTEATAAGVPVLAIPIFGDQFMNAQMTQDRGCGVLLSYTNITEDSFTWALMEVLENPKYTETAKKTYKLYHDRPVSAKNLVAFYAEHVIRTGGAKHLSPTHLPLYSYLLLDVVAVLAMPVVFLSLLTVWLCKKCCGQSKGQVKRKRE